MLIDHGHTLDDDSVNRYYLAGADHDHVERLEPIHGDLDFCAIAIKPDITGLLAEGVEEKLLRVVLGLLDQDPAEAQAPAKHRSWENCHRPHAPDDHDCVQHVDAQPLFLE